MYAVITSWDERLDTRHVPHLHVLSASHPEPVLGRRLSGVPETTPRRRELTEADRSHASQHKADQARQKVRQCSVKEHRVKFRTKSEILTINTFKTPKK